MKKMKGRHKKNKSIFKKFIRRLRRSVIAARWLQFRQSIGLFHRSPSPQLALAANTNLIPQAIELDNHFALDIPAWDSLLARLLGAVRQNHQTSTAGQDVEYGTLIVAVTLPAKSDRGDNFNDSLAITLSSVTKLQSSTENSIKIVLLGEDIPDTIHDAYVIISTNISNFTIYDSDTFILFIKPGDRVADKFFYAIENSILENKLLTFDMFFEQDNKIIPIFMPGFNLLHGIFCDYFRSRFMIRGDALSQAIKHFPEASPYELARAELIRQFVESDRSAGKHIPLPLIKIDDSAEHLRAERIACLEKRHFNGILPETMPSGDDTPRISIIISTKDKGYLLRQLLANILNTQMHLVRDIIIVSNHTSAPHAISTLREFSKHERVTVIEYHKEFNFSAQSNIGAAASKGDYLLFLNDDIVPVSSDWIHELLRMGMLPNVGIVAPLLLYPDERVQHAGMFLGYNGIAGHTLRFANLPAEDYGFMGSAPRIVSVVTGAVFMIERRLFTNLNGFDTRFATFIQDVDLCLRVRGSGYHVVFDPWAVLLHMESVTVKSILDNPVVQDRRIREHALFLAKWQAHLHADPFHNPNFELNDETLRRIRQPKEILPVASCEPAEATGSQRPACPVPEPALTRPGHRAEGI